MVRRRSLPRAMADLREGLLAPRGASGGRRRDSALDDPNGDDATRAGAPWTAAATATISLTMTAVKNGARTSPATFAECGWLAGTCVLALVALLVDASLLFVVYAARSARARSDEVRRARPARTHRRRVRRGGAHRARLREPGQPADHRRRPGTIVVLGVLENCSISDVFSAIRVCRREWFITCVSLAFVYPMTLARSN